MRLSWGESFGMDLPVTPTRHTDAANTSPTTGGSYRGPGLYCRATNQASSLVGCVLRDGPTGHADKAQMQLTPALQREDPTVVQASTAGPAITPSAVQTHIPVLDYSGNTFLT